MSELSADLPGVLGARSGEWWVIRPDAHVAAVVRDPVGVRSALARVLGRLEQRGEDENGVLPAAR